MKQNKTQWTQINNSFAILALSIECTDARGFRSTKVVSLLIFCEEKKTEGKLKYFSGTRRRQFLCVTTHNTHTHTCGLSREFQYIWWKFSFHIWQKNNKQPSLVDFCLRFFSCLWFAAGKNIKYMHVLTSTIGSIYINIKHKCFSRAYRTRFVSVSVFLVLIEPLCVSAESTAYVLHVWNVVCILRIRIYPLNVIQYNWLIQLDLDLKCNRDKYKSGKNTSQKFREKEIRHKWIPFKRH